MVGGLVEHQEVRRVVEHHRQHQPRLLAAGQHAHQLVHLVAREAEAAGQRAQRAFGDRGGRRPPATRRRSSSGRARPWRAARSSRASRCAPTVTVPLSAVPSPATSLSNVDLPAPLMPSTHQRSLRRIRKSKFVVDLQVAVGLVHARQLGHVFAARGEGLKSKCTFSLRRGGSTRSIFSSFFTRDCTCAACEARALKRSMKASLLLQHRLLPLEGGLLPAVAASALLAS